MMGLMSSIPVIRLYLYLRNVFISLESCILLGQGTLHTGLDRRLCGPKQFAMGFPLSTDYVSLSPDDDLGHLLQVISVAGDPNRCVEQLLRINSGHIPQHSQQSPQASLAPGP